MTSSALSAFDGAELARGNRNSAPRTALAPPKTAEGPAAESNLARQRGRQREVSLVGDDPESSETETPEDRATILSSGIFIAYTDSATAF
jgi:hypothetical protein